MSDVRIKFSICGDIVGEMESSQESFDTGVHKIPQNILNRISIGETVEISFIINRGIESKNLDVVKLDKEKLVTWMYENCFFSLRAADLLSEEIEKGTFTIS